ncbi:FAD-dependent oxidoreductase [Pseudoduganella sp. R-32]|uniref:FAD-dependent oxidoreductase n=1 Tax=Pseudoduganella sp. R-32 TaxID=3404061 RepID=UPI003CF119A6
MEAIQNIAVIGAGPAGLTAADTLRQLGYKKVTLFEQGTRVGGKVYTAQTPAGPVELGAVIASAECELVLGLAQRLGVAIAPYPVEQRFLDEHGVRHDAPSFLASRYSADEIGQAIANYGAALERYAMVRYDTLAGMPRELHQPFDRFAASHGFTPVAELARGALVGFGYGYYETVPALYFMKLIPWLFRPDGQGGLAPGKFHVFPQGFQGLWEGLARELDVRLGAAVTALDSPPGRPVQLTINGRDQHSFDAVVVAAPLHTAASFLPAGSEAAALLAQLRSNRYLVSAFAASSLPGGEFLFLHQNEHPERIGHMNAWANRNPALPMYLGWQLAGDAASTGQLRELLAADIAAQGGRLERVVLQQEWDYFPHVDGTALEAGYFERIDALQGQCRIYYAGGALNFETVEHSARQARALMRRHFG